jgi:hypothetical protein
VIYRRMSDMGPGCVKTCVSQGRASLQLVSTSTKLRQMFTRKLNDGLFTQKPDSNGRSDSGAKLPFVGMSAHGGKADFPVARPDF